MPKPKNQKRHQKVFTPDQDQTINSIQNHRLLKSQSPTKQSHDKSSSIVSVLQEKLKILIHNNNLPLPYFDEFQKALFGKLKKISKSRQQYIDELKQAYKNQIENLQNQCSFGQKINNLIEQRTQTLKDLKLMLIKQKIAGQQKKMSLNLSYISENLIQVRDLSLRIIEHLALWKSQLNTSDEDEYSKLIFQSMSKDIEFLRSSPLRKFLQFSSSQDPLLLHSLRKFQKLELTTNYNSRPILNILQVSQQYKKRLLHADKFIKNFNPKVVTLDYPFDQDYNNSNVDSSDAIEEEISEEQIPNHKMSSLKHSKEINLPSINQRSLNNSVRLKDQFASINSNSKAKAKYQDQNRVTQLLKPIMEDVKQKRNVRSIRLSTQINEDKPQSVTRKLKSLSRTKQPYQNDYRPYYAQYRNTSNSKKDHTELANRKYRLATQFQNSFTEQNSDFQRRKSNQRQKNQSHQIQSQILKNNLTNGKHKTPSIFEKRKKLKPLTKHILVHQSKEFSTNLDESNQLDEVSDLDEPGSLYKNQLRLYSKSKEVSSSRKTIKIPYHLSKTDQQLMSPSRKQQLKQQSVESPNNVSKSKGLKKSPTNPIDNLHETEKTDQKENEQIQYKGRSMEKDKKHDELKKILKKQQQLEKALKKYRLTEAQSEDNQINLKNDNRTNESKIIKLPQKDLSLSPKSRRSRQNGKIKIMKLQPKNCENQGNQIDQKQANQSYFQREEAHLEVAKAKNDRMAEEQKNESKAIKLGQNKKQDLSRVDNKNVSRKDGYSQRDKSLSVASNRKSEKDQNQKKKKVETQNGSKATNRSQVSAKNTTSNQPSIKEKSQPSKIAENKVTKPSNQGRRSTPIINQQKDLSNVKQSSKKDHKNSNQHLLKNGATSSSRQENDKKQNQLKKQLSNDGVKQKTKKEQQLNRKQSNSKQTPKIENNKLDDSSIKLKINTKESGNKVQQDSNKSKIKPTQNKSLTSIKLNVQVEQSNERSESALRISSNVSKATHKNNANENHQSSNKIKTNLIEPQKTINQNQNQIQNQKQKQKVKQKQNQKQKQKQYLKQKQKQKQKQKEKEKQIMKQKQKQKAEKLNLKPTNLEMKQLNQQTKSNQILDNKSSSSQQQPNNNQEQSSSSNPIHQTKIKEGQNKGLPQNRNQIKQNAQDQDSYLLDTIMEKESYQQQSEGNRSPPQFKTIRPPTSIQNQLQASKFTLENQHQINTQTQPNNNYSNSNNTNNTQRQQNRQSPKLLNNATDIKNPNTQKNDKNSPFIIKPMPAFNQNKNQANQKHQTTNNNTNPVTVKNQQKQKKDTQVSEKNKLSPQNSSDKSLTKKVQGLLAENKVSIGDNNKTKQNDYEDGQNGKQKPKNGKQQQINENKDTNNQSKQQNSPNIKSSKLNEPKLKTSQGSQTVKPTYSNSPNINILTSDRVKIEDNSQKKGQNNQPEKEKKTNLSTNKLNNQAQSNSISGNSQKPIIIPQRQTNQRAKSSNNNDNNQSLPVGIKSSTNTNTIQKTQNDSNKNIKSQGTNLNSPQKPTQSLNHPLNRPSKPLQKQVEKTDKVNNPQSQNINLNTKGQQNNTNKFPSSQKTQANNAITPDQKFQNQHPKETDKNPNQKGALQLNLSQLNNEPNLNKQTGSQLSDSSLKSSKSGLQNPNSTSLTKCIFQSRSLSVSELSEFLSGYKVHQSIISQIQKGYFKNRHLCLNLCLLNNQPISFLLTHPTIISSQRFIVVVLFKVVSQKQFEMSSRLLSTTLKYIFFNDPCENIICLKSKFEFEDQSDKQIQKSFIKQVKNVKGKIKNLFIQLTKEGKISSAFQQTAYMIARGQMACKNDEVYLNNIEFQINIIAKKSTKIPSKIDRLQFSQSYKQTIEKSFSQKMGTNNIKSFNSKRSLVDYLKEQEIVQSEDEKILGSINDEQKELYMYERLLMNFPPEIRFSSVAGVYYFSVEQNKSWYWEKNNVGYFIVRCQTRELSQINDHKPNLNSQPVPQQSSIEMSQWLKNSKVEEKKKFNEYFFIFMDYVFESDQLLNAADLIAQNIQSKPSQQVLKTQKQYQNKVVTVPSFESKQFVGNFQKDSFIINFKMNLNWKNYLKGVRSTPEDEILSEYIAPFYLGVLMKDQNNLMRFISGGHVLKDQEKVQQ